MKIRKDISTSNAVEINESEITYNQAILTSFEPTNDEEVRKLIKESPCKSSSIDPIPTWLIKSCLEILVPIITMVINLSVSAGEVPENLKEAILIPLIKQIC